MNLKVERGQYIAVIGVSGSGKSTLLHILGGLDTPDEGAVWVQQQELTALDRHQRTLYRRSSVGFIFQSYYLVASLTASENVALALTFQGVYGSERADAPARPWIESDCAAGRPSADGVSGGEQQRVAIARAIVNRPMLLLADEPTGNLDRATASEVVALLREIHSQLGTTVVMVTHDEELARSVADRVLRLRDGRLVEEGDGGR